MWHSSAVHVELGRGRLTRMASQARLAGLVLGCARPVPVVCQDSRCEGGKQASLGTAAAGSSIEQQWAEGPYRQCPHLWEPTALSLRAIGKAVEGITHVVCGPVDAGWVRLDQFHNSTLWTVTAMTESGRGTFLLWASNVSGSLACAVKLCRRLSRGEGAIGAIVAQECAMMGAEGARGALPATEVACCGRQPLGSCGAPPRLRPAESEAQAQVTIFVQLGSQLTWTWRSGW